MYQNTFETLAIETTLSSRLPIPNEKWQEIGCFFIQSYLEQLSKTEKYVIGHIKGLIELADDGFIKLSCVSRDKPINCESHSTGGNIREGRLTFNGIVSGIDKNKNLQFFHMALARTCSVFELMTDYREALDDESLSHQSDKPCPVCHGHHQDSNESCDHHD
jgi:hypothetical protein